MTPSDAPNVGPPGDARENEAIDPTEVEAARSVVAADLKRMAERLEPDLRELAGSRVLMTGGAGFIGYMMVQLFAFWNRTRPEHAFDVTVADNYLRGLPAWLAELDGRYGVNTLKHDITHPLPQHVGPFGWIIHAASIASPTFYRKFPLETMDANVKGLRLLLERSVAQADAGEPVLGFLFFSTSEIYGDPIPEAIPTPETYRGNVSCTGPRACYDESKRFGETLAVTFAEHYGVPVKTARPFNNYGPGLRLDDRRVLPDFARNVLDGEDIVMLSDGSPTRTFCYIADAVVGYLRILVRGRPGEPYNIGSPAPEISILELAEAMVDLGAKTVDYQGKVVRRTSKDADYLIDNPIRRCPDIAKAREELAYEPEIDLTEGLRRSLIWYRAGVLPLAVDA